MPGVRFISASKARSLAATAFRRQHRRLARLLPHAQIEHIGSTAVPGMITKGDLDILVRVSRPKFARADQSLAAHYARNAGSHHSQTFASFKDDAAKPPLGIQLAVAGGPEDDFLKFRDALRRSAALVRRYNQLKRRSAGLSMTAYRRRKRAFIRRVLAQAVA